MKKYNLESGDFVSYVAIPKTIGMLISVESMINGIPVWSVWWLKHPDINTFGQFGFSTETYLRPFKPWRGFYKD